MRGDNERQNGLQKGHRNSEMAGSGVLAVRIIYYLSQKKGGVTPSDLRYTYPCAR